MSKPPSYVINLRKIVLTQVGLYDAENKSFEINEQKYNECIKCASHSNNTSAAKVLEELELWKKWALKFGGILKTVQLETEPEWIEYVESEINEAEKEIELRERER